VAWVSGVGEVTSSRSLEQRPPTREEVDQSTVRCPDPSAAQAMSDAIISAKSENDSIGGVVTCVVMNVPLGLGEPVFDKLEAKLAHAMLSIPATKGFEIGSGFEGTRMRGSQHNDLFTSTAPSPSSPSASPSPSPSHSHDSIHLDGNYTGRSLMTSTNHSGGVQGGISNGENIVFRVAFKPPATIGQSQATSDFTGAQATLTAEGRHDPCVVPRAVPIVEAMAALVIADAAIIQLGRVGASHALKFPIVGKVQPQHATKAQQATAASAPAMSSKVDAESKEEKAQGK
jgi:chorismate synthase